MPEDGRRQPRRWRLDVSLVFAAAVAAAWLGAPRKTGAQAPLGVSRSWECWAMSISEQSLLPPAARDACGPVTTRIHLGPPLQTPLVSALVAPGAPASLVATVSGTSVILTWLAPAGGDPPTSYVLEAGSASGLANLANSDTGSALPTLTATNVSPGSYYVRVRARNSAGTSAPSNEVIVTLAGACTTAPTAPSALSATASGTSVSLTWQAPTTGCAPTGYVVEAGSVPGSSNLASFSTGSAATLYSASGVSLGTYYVRVRATNSAGTSAPSNEVPLTVTGCVGAVSAPANLVAQVNGTTVTLSWTASTGSPSSYIIEAGGAPGSATIVNDTGSLATSLIATASPGTYYVRVRARNACGTSAPSAEVVVTITSGSSCVTIAPASQAVPDTATVGSVAVTATTPSCSWTAVSNTSFITVTSGASGSGSGSVSYSVAANTSGNQRSGTLTIGGQTFTVTQQVCSFSLSAPVLFPDAGGGATVTVTTPSSCSWTATTDTNFISLTSSSSGTGTASLGLSAQPNSGIVRGGTLTVGQPFQSATTKLVQSGPAGAASCVTTFRCGFSCVLTKIGFGGGGGTSEVDVGAPSTCAWIATSTVPWVSVYSTSVQNQPYGVGNGHFGFAAAPNPDSAERSGAFAAGGLSVPVTQSACAYSVSPTSVNVLASGGTAAIAVTTSCSTPWTSSSNASFLTISGGSSGTGNGTVSVVVAANTGTARSGTVTVAGQTVTLTQAAP